MTEEKASFRQTVKGLPQSFWIANVMEIIERMAWYGFYSLSSIYICDAVSDGGLGLSSSDRGIIQGVVTFLIYLFPFVTGALGDRYGYKKMLLIAYIILAPSYLLLGMAGTMSTFFVVFLCVAVGASIFKPLVVGTIGRVSNEKNGSLAFGIFYMMVNIGGFIGPLFASFIRSQGWNYVFIVSAIWITLNIPILLLFYKEPPREDESSRAKPLKQVMNEMFEVIGNGRFFITVLVTFILFVLGCKWFPIQHVALAALAWIVINLLVDGVFWTTGIQKWRMRVGHVRFLLFLLLLSSFWIAYNQLFITLPLYIKDSIDSTPVMNAIMSFGNAIGMDTSSDGFLAKTFLDVKTGGLKPEHFINVNAFCIILFQVLVSILNARIKPLISIMVGIFLTGVSFVLIGNAPSAWFIIVGVAAFSFGEMMASPRAKEYTAHAVAPREKMGMYMGYYMWSNAIGSLFGGILSGALYKQIAQEMHDPTLMWYVFAGISVVCCVLIYLYHITVGRKIEQERHASEG